MSYPTRIQPSIPIEVNTHSMSDHQIKFRGGWEVDFGDGKVATRLTLPTSWPTGLHGSIRLVRRFGRPPVREIGETYRIELLCVPGLISVKLNGRELMDDAMATNPIFPLPEPLLDRNILELELDLAAANRISPAEEWGAISLRIIEKVGNPG
jgi:hypothetical protein